MWNDYFHSLSNEPAVKSPDARTKAHLDPARC
jgi:hypothetical protein